MLSRVSRLAMRLAAAAIATGVLIAPAGAQQASQEGVRKAFAEADANRDGYLNIDEYVGHVILVFKGADRNGDGFIVASEAVAHNPTHNPADFTKADRNGDGRLSMGEVVAAKIIIFFDVDSNKDGVLTVDEVLAYERALPAAGGKK
jgi:hypothetical protein